MRNHLIIAALLSFLVIYLNINSNSNESGITEEASLLEQSEYDYYMNNIDNTVFTPAGEPRYRVQAAQLTHYPTGDITLLESPRFSVYMEESPPWNITAGNAQVDEDALSEKPRISLIENVVILHTDNEGRSLSIYTDFLEIHPEDKTLSSDQMVTVRYPGFELTGTGMTYNMNTKQLNLLSDVSARGSYE